MSPQPDTASLASGPFEYSREEREILLQLAHEAIVSTLEGREVPLEAPTIHLAEPRGAFTTLYYRGNLRGCVGYITALVPLYQTVVDTARGAAFDDTRFRPVTREELPDLRVSLSVLSPVRAIEPEEIEIGKHGLVISHGGYRGLLLPQVAAEQDWDRVTFLRQTCRKAGLPLDAWQKGAKVEAFTAEVFGEDGLT